jgi:hypothetical protein
VRRYESGYTVKSGRRDCGKWCSGGPEGMVRAKNREDSGSFRRS